MTDANLPGVSVVVPCLNEEWYIVACLEALQRQTLPPEEIILVDNGCTDQTVALARKTFPKIKVITEPHRGVALARDAGFAAAMHPFVARLDADTVAYPQWLEQLVAELEKQPEVAAVTSLTDFYDVRSPRVARWFLDWAYFRYNARVAGVWPLFGASMLIRQAAWQRVQQQLHHENDRWEDLDLACALAESHLAVVYIQQPLASISFRSGRTSAREQWRYMRRWPRTFRSFGLHRAEAAAIAGLFFLAMSAPLVQWAGRFRNPR